MNRSGKLSIFSILIVTMIALGCGGGGAGTSKTVGGGTGGVTSGPVQTNATANVHVDVTTGQVTITSLTGPTGAPAVFQGNTIGFTSSVLVDQAGDVGRKALSVSLVNNSGELIGQDSNGATNGLKVIFGTFTNVDSFLDLRQFTNVSTLAGTSAAGAVNGAVGSATFQFPTSVAIGADGSTYIADQSNHRIRKITAGVVSTFAGSGTVASVDGVGTLASFNHPWGIALNPVDGALIVTENGGNKIRRITPDGRVKTIAGTGTAGASNGTGATATFQTLTAVAVSPTGVIYACDDAQTIRQIVFNGGDATVSSNYTVSTLAGAGTAGFADGVGAAAKFNTPRGVTCDSAGNLYVADYGNQRIRFITPQGEVTTIAGTGVASSLDGTGTTATFNAPSGIVYAGGALYVAEYGGKRIRQLTLTQGGAPGVAGSWTTATLAGNGSAGLVNGIGSSAEFKGPTGLAVDHSGGLVVAGYSEDEIRSVTPTSGVFPLGIPTGSTSNQPVELEDPTGLIANSGAPFISYPGSLAPRASTAAQNWVFVIPSGVTAFEFTVTVEADTEIYAPVEAAMNAGSPLNQVRTLAGEPGVEGNVSGNATTAQFNIPINVAVDSSGNAYVTDANVAAVKRVDPFGNVVTIAGTKGSGFASGPGNVAQFANVTGIAIAPGGSTLYVADFNCVRRVTLTAGADPTNSANWNVSTIAGTDSAGYTDGAGSDAQFQQLYGLAAASDNLVYVAELGGNRVRRLQFDGGDPSQATNWTVSTLAGSPSATPGSGNGQGTAATFNGPSGLAVDLAGNIYVADQENNEIRKITPSGLVSLFAGSTTAGSSDGASASATFEGPEGVAVDPAGYVYVCDTDNGRVRRIAPTGYVETVAGNGGGPETDGAGNVAIFNSNRGIAVTASGTLIVVDSYGYTVRTIQRVLSQGAPAKSGSK